MNKTYLIAGATGYLGKHLVKAANAAGHRVHAVARSPENVPDCADEVIVAEATNAESLVGICDGVDVVVSSLGITRQRDGLSYERPDLGAEVVKPVIGAGGMDEHRSSPFIGDLGVSCAANPKAVNRGAAGSVPRHLNIFSL